jgi:adenylate cyclase
VVFMFSDYTLDVDRRELRRGSEPVPVEPQVFDLLILLIQNRDRVVSKDDLIASIWGGRIVSESALTSRINAARKAVGDSGEHQRLIRTISRKGIRFVAEVSERADSPAKVVTADRPSLLPSSSASPAENRSLPPLNKPSVAVMPFLNLSGDPEWDYFAEGIAEDIITELSRVSALFVIARNSSFTYRGRSPDLRQVGCELGVRYIVEGTVRRGGDRIRITANLIEAETGKNLWAEKYDRELADMFIVQDEIIAGLVASLQTQVVLNEGLVVERQGRPDLPVWDLAKRGLKEIYELTRESLERARAIGHEILSLDCTSSKGHQLVALGAYHLVLMGFTDSPDRFRDEALRAARDAVRYEPKDEYSQWALGVVLGSLLARYEEAVSSFIEALRINPNFSLGFASLGSISAYACRPDEAIANTEIAIRLNPRDPSVFFRYSALSLAYFVEGDFVTARDWAQKTISSKSEWWLGHALLAASRAHLQDTEGAREAGAELTRLFPKFSINALPFPAVQDPSYLEVFRAGLHKAGLPAFRPRLAASR